MNKTTANKLLLKAIALLLIVLGTSVPVVAKATIGGGDSNMNVKKFITDNFGKGKLPPFSFKYGGKASAEFIGKWNHSLRQQLMADGAVCYLAVYQDPATGLEIACDIKGFADYSAVEWTLRFTNKGSANTPQISEVNAADINIDSKTGDYHVHYSNGTVFKRTDFMQNMKVIGSAKDSLYLRADGGRPSSKWLPYINVETSSPRIGKYSGVILSIGWTGVWHSNLKLDGATSMLRFTTGQYHLNSYLRPNESVRSPLVSFLPWQGGNEYAGNNKFRRFITAHHTHKIDGKPNISPISSGFEEQGYPKPCDLYSCLNESWAKSLMKQHHMFGMTPEVYWIDAGWFELIGDYDWGSNVGTWDVDKRRFPNGLAPIAQEAHRYGAKFMVWFEPERTTPKSKWRRNHPEYMLHADGKRCATLADDTDPTSTLVDLSKPEVLRWVTDSIGDVIESNGIDYYRQDFNIDPEPFWVNNDEPGRAGMIEAKYVENLYKFWDGLYKRFPRLYIDNCASGAKRLDLEMVSRGTALWRDDYNWGEPNGYQCHTYGLNLYIPQHGTGVVKPDAYTGRSSLSSAVIMSWAITDRGNRADDIKARINEYRTLRPYFLEDYYPLCGTDRDITADDIWLAYQLNRPSDGTGYIVAFRRPECADSTFQAQLYDLDPAATYQVTNIDNHSSIKMTGKQLADKGVTLILGKPRESLIIYYEKEKPAKK